MASEVRNNKGTRMDYAPAKKPAKLSMKGSQPAPGHSTTIWDRGGSPGKSRGDWSGPVGNAEKDPNKPPAPPPTKVPTPIPTPADPYADDRKYDPDNEGMQPESPKKVQHPDRGNRGGGR